MTVTLLWRTGRFLAVIVALAAASCTDGGSQEGRGVVSGSPGGAPPPATATGDQPTELEAASFLSAATFGPTRAEIDHLVNIGYSAWFREQYAVPMTAVTTTVPLEADFDDTVDGWWRNTVYGRDQLRQRAAFALSQIFVVSGADGDLRSRGHAFARYIDLMQESAFASYRDVLEEVTYSPAMGVYLTYIGNEKADPDKGSVPDENYAREVMQLFSIGVVELNSDGTERLDGDGR
ncbi:MAG: DUF1800 domain-containing protein, partial [Caulobacterales bacterium]|nr:DUF1800 domain-containing protein [Caulobacterales bacterium]